MAWPIKMFLVFLAGVFGFYAYGGYRNDSSWFLALSAFAAGLAGHGAGRFICWLKEAVLFMWGGH